MIDIKERSNEINHQLELFEEIRDGEIRQTYFRYLKLNMHPGEMI